MTRSVEVGKASDAFRSDARYFVAVEALRSVVREYQSHHPSKWPPYAVIAKAALEHLERT